MRSQLVAHFEVGLEHTLRSHVTGVCMIAVLVVTPYLLTLDVSQGSDNARVSIARVAMPSACPSREILGIGCPGCGMTRSFVATAHGQWSAAVTHHPLGPFLYGYFLVLLLLHGYGAILIRRPLPRILVRGHYWGGTAVIVALIAVWLVRLALA